MAGVIQVGGLASGLDTGKIIDQLVALERRPLDLLGKQVTATQATQTSIGTVSTKLAALLTAARALGGSEGALVRKASSSEETVLTAVAGGGAAPGATTITVTGLARGSVATSSVGVASATSTIASGAGSFQFRVGTGAVQSVAVDGTTTLQGLVDGINLLHAGVTASVVNVGTSASPDYRLQITSQSTGAANDITVVGDGTTIDVENTQAAEDAAFTVSGFATPFARATNTFGDVIPGVTISLKSEGTATVTVADDAEKSVERVKTLVDAFNDLVTFVNGESVVQQTKDKNDVQVGTLATDQTVKRLVDRLHDLFSESVTGATTQYVNLSSLGLATQKDGTIVFDETKYTAALAADPTAVAEVFSGNGTAAGIANDIVTYLGEATGAGGVLAKHTSALDDQIRSLQDEIDAGQRKVDAFEEGLVQQFAALESLVSSLQSQSGFLSSALG